MQGEGGRRKGEGGRGRVKGGRGRVVEGWGRGRVVEGWGRGRVMEREGGVHGDGGTTSTLESYLNHSDMWWAWPPWRQL